MSPATSFSAPSAASAVASNVDASVSLADFGKFLMNFLNAAIRSGASVKAAALSHSACSFSFLSFCHFLFYIKNVFRINSLFMNYFSQILFHYQSSYLILSKYSLPMILMFLYFSLICFRVFYIHAIVHRPFRIKLTIT